MFEEVSEEQAWFDTLDGIEQAFDSKAENIAVYIKNPHHILLKNTIHNGNTSLASTIPSALTPEVSATKKHPKTFPNIINNIFGISLYDLIYPILPVYKLKSNKTIEISPTANRQAANGPPPS